MPFIGMHVAVLGVLWTGARPIDWAVCGALYFIRMFAVTAGYHRYFSHRAFKTSRLGQFLLAFAAETSSQKGVLWWASHHRWHHKYSDKPEDIHSPRQRGFWYSHVGWIFAPGMDTYNEARVRDLAAYPELCFISRFWMLPPLTLALAVFLTLGWSGLVVGFFLSTVLLYHGSFVINSLAHVFGRRRYDTEDDSRNSAVLALITLGEGWHNNHHRCMTSARQGFFWWEVDISYAILKMLSWFGLVWDLKQPPKKLLQAQ